MVYEPGNFNVWLKLVEYGRKTGEFDCILWSPYCLPESMRYQDEAISNGSIYIEETTPSGGLADIYSRLSGWLSADFPRLPNDLAAIMDDARTPADPIPSVAAFDFLEELSDSDRLSVLREVDIIRRRINFCDDWLARLGVDAVLLAEDNVERDSYAWIAGAKRRQIKSVVLSYGALSEQEAINAYKRSQIHAVDQAQAEFICKWFPHWLAEGEDFCITRIPFRTALAREFTNTAPFNPWLVNAGHADSIAVESAVIRRLYLEHGFEEDSVQPIGHPMQDTLACNLLNRDHIRSRYCEMFGLDKSLPIAVVGIPPDNTATTTGCYTEYAGVIRSFSEIPRDILKMNVLVSLHPNIPVHIRDALIVNGYHYVEGSASSIIPIADLYIASTSSTIKWAISCGIPTINYDCYSYDYDDFRDCTSVIHVSTEQSYQETLAMLNSPQERTRLTGIARAEAQEWGVLDGRATDRLIRLSLG